MIKKKLLYEYRSCKRENIKFNRKKYKISNSDSIPFNEKMNSHIDYDYGYLNLKPLEKFIKSKVGQNWNDVYSEILTKIEQKKRYLIDRDLKYIVLRPYHFDNNGIAYNKRYYWCNGVTLNHLYIDKFNIIRYHETKEEMIADYKREIRRKKLERILR